MNEYIDTHAHIYDRQFTTDIAEVLERAQESRVKRIYMPNIDHKTIDGMLLLEEEYPDVCVPMMGLHPSSVDKHFEKELYEVEAWLSRRAFVAVGETGIDLYWDKTYQAQQEEAFRVQIEWAKQYEIPIIIHCRDSFEETIGIVEELQDGRLRGIFHCFTGNAQDANRIVKAGFWIGIGGVATFKNGGLDQVIPEIAPGRMVLETDSPYLAPAPSRGKRNEPSFIPVIARKVADFLKTSVEDVAEMTTKNAEAVFRK